ncbi:ankyrin repeat protein, partial [Colletotrichum incanum]
MSDHALPLQSNEGLSATDAPVVVSSLDSCANDVVPAPVGLWELAFQSLSAKDRNLMVKIGDEENARLKSGLSIKFVPQLDQLIELTRKKQQVCDKNAWKVRLPGQQEIILRDVAEKIIKWLDTFKAVADVAIQFDPIAAALPWAAVRFFIQTAVQAKTTMHHLLTVVEHITRVASRCQLYEILYLQGGLQRHGAEDLQQSLVDLYRALFRMIAHSYNLLCQGTIKRAFHTVIKPQETSEMMEEVRVCEFTVRDMVAACEAAQITDIEDTSNDLHKILKRLESPIFRVDIQVGE